MVENKCYHPHCNECKDNRCTKYLNVKNCASVKTESPKWVQDKIKKLNIIEVSNTPIGTEFEMIRNGADMPSNVYIDNDTCLRWKRNDEPFSPYVDNFNAIFVPIKVQKPVSFMEVVESNKKCKVEHELITDLLNSDITLKEFDNDELEYKWFMEYKNKGYLQINLLMDIVMGFLNAREYKTVIKEGKWYLSEEEDIDIS